MNTSCHFFFLSFVMAAGEPHLDPPPHLINSALHCTWLSIQQLGFAPAPQGGFSSPPPSTVSSWAPSFFSTSS